MQRLRLSLSRRRHLSMLPYAVASPSSRFIFTPAAGSEARLLHLPQGGGDLRRLDLKRGCSTFLRVAGISGSLRTCGVPGTGHGGMHCRCRRPPARRWLTGAATATRPRRAGLPATGWCSPARTAPCGMPRRRCQRKSLRLPHAHRWPAHQVAERRCEQPGLSGARRLAAHHGATRGGGGRAHPGRDHMVAVGGD